MADTPPLLFRRHLGSLRPANAAAEKAVAALTDGQVRVKIMRTRGNDKRMRLYWAVLSLSAPLLSERCEGDALDETMLHRVLKRRRGLFTTTTLPSGEVIENLDSISFHSMAEPERAEYVDWAMATLSKWLGVDVATLRSEAETA